MKVYQPEYEDDLLLAQWWAYLDQKKDELKLTFGTSCHTLSGFMRLFQAPNILAYEVDGAGICFALWFEPVMSGAFMGLWVAPHKRRVPSTLRNIEAALSQAFKQFSVILGITKQERLIIPHTKLGYQLMGKLPGIFDGEDAWLLKLTKEGFDGRRRKEGRSKREQRARTILGGVQDPIPTSSGRTVQPDSGGSKDGRGGSKVADRNEVSRGNKKRGKQRPNKNRRIPRK